MLSSLGRFVVGRRRAVLVASVLAMVVAGALGGGVAQHLSGGGFEDPGAESARARKVLERSFGSRTPNLVLLVTSADGSVDKPGGGRRRRRPHPGAGSGGGHHPGRLLLDARLSPAPAQH